MVKVTCSCGVQLQLEDQWAGKRGKCPRCGAMLDIPALHTRESEADVSPPPLTDDPFTPAPAATAPVSTPTRQAPPPRQAAAPPVQPPPVVSQASPRKATAENWLSQPVQVGKQAIPRYGLLAAGGGVVVLLLVLLVVGLQLGRSPELASHDSPDQSNQPAEPAAARPADSRKGTPSASPREATPDNVTPGEEIPAEQSNQVVADQPHALQLTDNVARNTLPRPPSANNTPGNISLTPTPSEPQVETPGNGSFGLSGASGRYDDQHCQVIQNQFGIRVPAAATLIEVNGQRLPLTNLAGLQESPSPYLLLPAGTHAVRWRPGELAVEVQIDADHDQIYQDMRTYFALDGEVKTGELRTRSARAMDVHAAPYLLNFAGAAYANSQKWAAAERAFRRSLRVNPLYSPAHMNLAHCLHRSGDLPAAQRELDLADMFNVGNVFGLHKAIVDMRSRLAAADSTVTALPQTRVTEFLPELYISKQSRTAEDRRIEALMQAMSKYAVRPAERGKILNNLAIHYSSSGRTELALEHFRAALGAVRQAGPERFTVARAIFANMQAACEATGFEEAADYAWMQQAVRP